MIFFVRTLFIFTLLSIYIYIYITAYRTNIDNIKKQKNIITSLNHLSDSISSNLLLNPTNLLHQHLHQHTHIRQLPLLPLNLTINKRTTNSTNILPIFPQIFIINVNNSLYLIYFWFNKYFGMFYFPIYLSVLTF